jgi:hypothetical protein
LSTVFHWCNHCNIAPTPEFNTNRY